MAKKDDTHPILLEIKNTAKNHQAFEKERGKDLIYGHALDIASKKLVNVDWNTACAMAKKGTLSMHDEPVDTESMFKINFPDVRDEEIIKTFYDLIDQDKAAYTPVLIPAKEAHSYFDQTSTKIEDAMRYVRDGRETHVLSGTQSLSDFTPSSQKVFYSKRNRLMGEWETLLTDPNYEEIPYEIESFEEMGLWAKNHGGILLFPTSSIADLRDLSEAQMEAIESNFSTHSFVVGRTRDAGKPFSIEGLIQRMREENPSLSEEEITIKVYDSHHALKAINGDENFKRSFFTNLRKYGGAPVQKSKSFVRTSNDKHAKAKFSARSR